MSKSDSEAAFLYHCRVHGLPEPLREYRFAAMAVGGTGRGLRKRLADRGLRDWRVDFAWLGEHGVFVEVEGGTYSNGRHVRPAGYREDCEKYNAAVALGHRVYRATSEMITEGCPELMEILRRELAELLKRG